jgi:hypothetical protein
MSQVAVQVADGKGPCTVKQTLHLPRDVNLLQFLTDWGCATNWEMVPCSIKSQVGLLFR